MLAAVIGGSPAAVASDSDLDSLRRKIAGILAAAGPPGVAVAVVDAGGQSRTMGFGRADLESGRPVDGDTLFRVGSVSKSFLGLALMRLVEKGRLAPDTPVRDLAPEIAVGNAWEASTPLRLEHLLEHTAGFDEMRFNEIFAQQGREGFPLRELLAVNPRSRVTRWRPGTRFSYSQPGYTVAAYLLEKVSGMPYEELLEEEVFGPLDIRSATYRLTPAARARLATGYEDGARRPYRPLLHRPAAGLMVSARDLTRLVAMLAGRGEIDGRRYLSPESIARIERCGTLPFGAPAVSYGLGNWGDVSQRVPTRGHGGWMPGYRSRFRYSPDRRFGYLVLVNDSGGSPAFELISEALVAHLLGSERPAAPPVVPIPPEDLAPYAGYYRLADPPIELERFLTDVYAGITLSVDHGRLLLDRPNRPPVALAPMGGRRFRLPRESDSSIELLYTADGRRAVSLGREYYEEASAAWAVVHRWTLQLAMLSLMSLALPAIRACFGAGGLGGGLLARPLVAALCLLGMWWTFESACESHSLGACNPATISIWVLSWGFAVASLLAFERAVRAARATLSRWLRAYALLTAGAAAGVAVHLFYYGIIGLRTWRW